MQVKSLRCVRLLATPWTAAYQAPPSMGFSRQEYWKIGVPLPSPKYCYDQVKKFYQREIMIVGKAFMSISYLSHVNTLISMTLCEINKVV